MNKIIKLLSIFLMLTILASTATAATLTVDQKCGPYKTIQKAVNAAHDGDTIYVKAGTYKETVQTDGRHLIFQGAKVNGKYVYPSVYGFNFGYDYNIQYPGSGDINGFKIVKTGVSYGVIGNNIVRNNYFYNCGVGAGGQTCSGNTIMNNKFTGNYNYNGVDLTECYDNSIIGNTFSKARNGVVLRWGAGCSTITKNTFSGCKVGFLSSYIPDVLLGNTYKGNKINIKIVEDF